MPTLGGTAEPVKEFGGVGCNRSGRRLGTLAHQFQQDGWEHFEVGPARKARGVDDLSFSNGSSSFSPQHKKQVLSFCFSRSGCEAEYSL